MLSAVHVSDAAVVGDAVWQGFGGFGVRGVQDSP